MYSPRFAMFTSFTTYSDDLIESDDHKIRFAQVTRPYGKPRLGKEKVGVEQWGMRTFSGNRISFRIIKYDFEIPCLNWPVENILWILSVYGWK